MQSSSNQVSYFPCFVIQVNHCSTVWVPGVLYPLPLGSTWLWIAMDTAQCNMVSLLPNKTKWQENLRFKLVLGCVGYNIQTPHREVLTAKIFSQTLRVG